MALPTSLAQPQLYRLPNLLQEIDQGLLRVPRFQRAFVWGAEQRRLLIDSLREGIPIGSLLLWRSHDLKLATYDVLGPFTLPQPAPGCRYILDGHQRLATLYGALASAPATIAAEEGRWQLYYDLTDRQIYLPPANQEELPLHWLPLRALLDPVRLYEHQKRLLDQDPRGNRPRVNLAENLANRLKDTLVPVVILDSDDLGAVKQTFQRINQQGSHLSEVHLASALTWAPQYDLQADLVQVAEQLAPLGFGGLEPQLLLDTLKVGAGLDLDRPDPGTLASRLKNDPARLQGLLRQLQHAALFLNERCGVAGPAALPHPLQLILLAEAARVHGGPLVAALAEELARWFWLTSLSDWCSRLSGQTLRAAVAHMQALCRGEAGPRPPELPRQSVWSDDFDFATAVGRALALSLAAEGPLDSTGQPLAAARLLAALAGEAVPRIIPLSEGGPNSPENRWLADPRDLPALREVLRRPQHEHHAALLRSHVIPADAAVALAQGDTPGFLERRRRALRALVEERFAALLTAAPLPAVSDRAAPALLVSPPPPVGLTASGVPRVAVQGEGLAWLEDAIRGAGLSRWRSDDHAPALTVEALPQVATEHQRWRILSAQPAAPQGVGTEALADVLCRLRAAALPGEGPVRLALWSYSTDDTGHPDAAYAVGALLPAPPSSDLAGIAPWEALVRLRFEEAITAPLRRIRQALGARAGERWVLFHPRCLPGVAIRAGVLYNHQSGFWVDCEQNGVIWDLNRQPAPLELPNLLADVAEGTGSAYDGEIHLLISLSRDVRDAYDAWLREAPGRAPRHRLHVQPRGGPGPTALSAHEVVDWADAVRQRLTPLRTRLEAPLRIFCATPIAFCVALGRSLNAMGRVITMDLSKQGGRYFPSFDFTA